MSVGKSNLHCSNQGLSFSNTPSSARQTSPARLLSGHLRDKCEVHGRMNAKPARRGAAAVEFALTLPLLMVLLLGLWEVGRLIQLAQVLNNAAREGARVAAQGMTINNSGSPTLIHVSSGSPNVKQTIV